MLKGTAVRTIARATAPAETAGNTCRDFVVLDSFTERVPLLARAGFVPDSTGTRLPPSFIAIGGQSARRGARKNAVHVRRGQVQNPRERRERLKNRQPDP